jgi:hypothetical protein
MVEEILETDNKGEDRFQEPAFAEFCDRIIKADTMPSRIILTSQERPPAIAQGRYLERSHLQLISGLNEREALELFEIWDIKANSESERSHLQRIAHAYEGHPLSLRVIAGEIREPPFNHQVTAYWHEYGEEIAAVEWLKNVADRMCQADKLCLDCYSINLTEQVKVRIEKTCDRLQRSSKLAYLLLCRGANYRRAVERSAWLFAIAEYPPQEQMQAFQLLQRRCLLQEEYIGGKVFYRLHHLLRREASDRLTQLEGASC